MHSGHLLAATALFALAASYAQPAHAQQIDSARAPAARGARFVGQINNLTTTRPVTTADVRLMWVDSAHTEKDVSGKESSEFFIDTTRSRVGITNDSGTFAINNVLAGRYVMNVRRIGFEPVQALLTMGTSMMEMELAMTQNTPMLPEVKITESAVNRVTRRLDRVGYTSRYRMGTSGHFVDRAEILRRHPHTVTDILIGYGIGENATFYLDRMPTDWEELMSYPADLMIGVEIYRHRGAVPNEFNQTLGEVSSRPRKSFSEPGLAASAPVSRLALGPGGSGGIDAPTVFIWTYIP